MTEINSAINQLLPERNMFGERLSKKQQMGPESPYGKFRSAVVAINTQLSYDLKLRINLKSSEGEARIGDDGEVELSFDHTLDEVSFRSRAFDAIGLALIFAKASLCGLLEGYAFQSIIALCDIMDILLLFQITKSDIARLRQLLARHQHYYTLAYGEFKTTISSHYLQHFPTCIENLTIPMLTACFWSERAHQILKHFPSSSRPVDRQAECLLRFSSFFKSRRFDRVTEIVQEYLRMGSTPPPIVALLEKFVMGEQPGDEHGYLDVYEAAVRYREIVTESLRFLASVSECSHTDITSGKWKVALLDMHVKKFLDLKRPLKQPLQTFDTFLKKYVADVFPEHLIVEVALFARCKVNGLMCRSRAYRYGHVMPIVRGLFSQRVGSKLEAVIYNGVVDFFAQVTMRTTEHPAEPIVESIAFVR